MSTQPVYKFPLFFFLKKREKKNVADSLINGPNLFYSVVQIPFIWLKNNMHESILI